MCAQVNRQRSWSLLRCGHGGGSKRATCKNKSTSFRLNSTGDRRVPPTPSGTSSSWCNTEIGCHALREVGVSACEEKEVHSSCLYFKYC